MVRAQATAWSERRSQGGAVVVVIMEVSSRGCCWVVGLSRSDHTGTDGYVPVFRRLTHDLVDLSLRAH